MSKGSVDLLRAQYKAAHDVLENTIADVTKDQANWVPPGVANPLGATYAHILTSEDGVYNAIVRGDQPLMATSWAGQIGLSEMPPRGGSWSEWGRRVEVDLEPLRQYGQAVYKATDDYLSTLDDSDLSRDLDMSAIGLGMMTLGQLASVMLANVNWHTGEISCLKGLQGMKGYPF